METRDGEQPRSFLIVGIGASAGGLEVLEEFFSRAPAESGFAYVVVQHLAPQHASMLTELLGRDTSMPVVEAEDGVVAEPDHVYVIAPGTVLRISGGVFQVARGDGDRHEQIDVFLRSLAEDRGESAIGIILSGSGADGTEGLRAIKQHGGLTLVQRPETAKYDNMPKSAIDAGMADRTLPVVEMPAAIIERARRVADGDIPSSPAAEQPRRAPSPSDQEILARLDRIWDALHRATGHDFSRYKRGTVLRRIRRRLHLHGLSSADAYLELLGRDSREPELLAQDLLIGVTQFFRDPEAFDYLGSNILPQMLAAGGGDEGVRIWVPGCASGEEAYSLGILVRECCAALDAAPSVQIFATDIDAEAIAQARLGRYRREIERYVTPERLARFFNQNDSFYQVAKEVRDMCIFSEHSLIRDPPFSALDLISCRNVLIYLETALQKKLVPVFHYALKREGYLFLGPSEGLAAHPELFETVEKRFRVFQRVESVSRPVVEFPLGGRPVARVAARLQPVPAAPPTQEQAISAAFERLMLQEYAPPGAIVDERGEILCVVGPTGKYLQPLVGVLTTNILDIAHASLRIELRAAIHGAARSGRNVTKDVQLDVEGLPRRLRLTVRPFGGARREGLFAIILQEASREEPSETTEAESSAAGTGGESAMEQLENELRTTRASLRSTIEELESANEELKSANEELLSTNEEMQSSNEELQSSQEELKSVNEELATVNAELGRKVDELAHANSDLQNLFSSTDVVTVFLDRELRITQFTPAARALFGLIDADVGRPLSDLARARFVNADLTADAGEVVRTLRPIERQVETTDRQSWYLLRVLPYRTVEEVIAGAVVTLADITQIKRGEAALRRLATVVIDSNDAITVLDFEGRILDWNRGAERTYGYSRAEARQMTVDALVPDEDRAEARRLLEALRRGEAVESLEVRRRTKDGRTIDVWLTSTTLTDDLGNAIGAATTEHDITGRKRSEAERESLVEELREANERLLEADRRKDEFLGMLSHELRNPLTPIRNSIYILERAAPGGEQARRAVKVLDRQAGHLTHLVEDLLDVTRIAKGRVRLRREVVDLCELTRRTVEDHAAQFAEKEVTLEVRAGPEKAWIYGDRIRLAQVLGNLLQNAAKFTPRGGKASVAVERDSARAILRVQDTGRGIAPELLSHIFEPFTQADRTLDRSLGGLGLGLSLVKNVVEMHGGSVAAASGGPNQGATFTITLPLEATRPTGSEPPGSGSGESMRRVLIIEDNGDAANSLREALELGGYLVDIARTGPEGIEKARSFAPEVVLCDLGLPQMDGYEVARTIRAAPELAHLRLVALTGYAGPEHAAKAREAGFDAFLPKPPSIDAVKRVVAEVLDQEESG